MHREIEMNCKQVQPRLSEYIDNSLSARDTWEIDRHVVDCNPCNRQLNELRRTVELLTAAPRREVSDDFTASLQTRLERLEPAPARWAWVEGIGQAFRPRVMP